jgi:hypothetical protein
VREGACIGAATILQPWTLRLILNSILFLQEQRKYIIMV